MELMLTQWKTGVGELQLALAVLLFFITNWIGKHSFSIGYVSISIYTQEEDAPAFNYIVRVFTPIVYIIIVSALLYSFELNKFVYNIYFTSIYYVLFRFTINLLQDRARLINWPRQLLYYSSIIFISWLVYTKFISTKSKILPDFTSIANEMWIIIILFLYKLVNEIEISSASSQKRKENYLNAKYKEFRKRYGRIIDNELKNDVLKAVAYAIIIHENFNRPFSIRLLENISFFLTKRPHSLGVMQIPTKSYVNDEQSIILGTKKILSTYKLLCNEFVADNDYPFQEYYIYNDIISKYNGGSAYQQGVGELVGMILEKYYPNTKDTLNPSLRVENTPNSKPLMPLLPSDSN